MRRGDKGPFASMGDALERAITSYGTPPYREMVRVSVREIGHYRFDRLPMTLDDWVEWLTEVRTEAPERYRDGVHCVLQWDHGYYDSGATAILAIWYERPETDDEMTLRVNRGIEYVRKREANERTTYEALKRKFG